MSFRTFLMSILLGWLSSCVCARPGGVGVTPPPAGSEILSGRVQSSDGKGIAGATVAAFSLDEDIFEAPPVALVQTQADGRFALQLPTGHEYSITATAPAYAPAYLLSTSLGANAAGRSAVLTLGSGQTRVLSGRVTLADGSPAVSASVRALPGAGREHEAYAPTIGTDGSFTMSLTADKYMLIADAPDATFVIERVPAGTGNASVAMRLRPPPAPFPTGGLEALKQAAIPLDLGSGAFSEADARRLDALLCGARVVGIGESTHGSSEFTLLRGRVLFRLADSCGFNALLIEADTAAIAALDDYVVHGRGDPRQALASTGSWPYMHAEMLRLIESIRQHNAVHEQPIHIIGIDPFFSAASSARVRAYLKANKPELLTRVEAAFGRFEKGAFWTEYPALPDVDKAGLRAALDDVGAYLEGDAGRVADPDEWRDVMLHFRALRSVERRFSAAPGEGGLLRDRDMAENVRWALDHYLSGGKGVLAAHNGHVMLGRPVWKTETLGDLLGDAYGNGTGYLAVGVLFGHGSFTAVEVRDGAEGDLGKFSLGPPPSEDLDGVLAAVALPAFIVDLAPSSMPDVLRPWLESELRHRELGTEFSTDEAAHVHTAPAMTFHVLGFINQVSATELL
jgi:erythromycin esterase